MTSNRGRKRKNDDVDALLGSTDTPKTGPDGWPDPAPVLVADDLAWQWSTARGRRDLSEWLDSTFEPHDPFRTPKRDKARRLLCKVITERFGKRVKSLWLFLEFTKDNRLPSLKWQAACWNEMLARLGYDVPEEVRRDPGFTGK